MKLNGINRTSAVEPISLFGELRTLGMGNVRDGMQRHQRSGQNRICCKVAYLLNGERWDSGDIHDCKFLKGSSMLRLMKD